MADSSEAVATRRTIPKAYIFWLLGFVGAGGIHRIYAGKYATGILWLMTGGLFGIGQLIDLALIPDMIAARNRRKEPQSNIANPSTSNRLQGRALMRRIIQLAEQRQGVLTATAAIAAIDADLDDIEAAFRELELRGYAYGENHPVTGAVQYRFASLFQQSILQTA
ncbi:MAG: TM2 domain-containing protein [Pseudomonadota bacterium]